VLDGCIESVLGNSMGDGRIDTVVEPFIDPVKLINDVRVVAVLTSEDISTASAIERIVSDTAASEQGIVEFVTNPVEVPRAGLPENLDVGILQGER